MRNFHKVTDNLYRGGDLHPQDVLYLKEKLNINKIISLDEVVGQRIDRTAKLLGIEHIIIPLNGTVKSIKKLLSYDLGQLLGTGRVFVGCVWGKDRTGLVIALFECKYLHKKPEDAIQEAKSFGFGLGLHPKVMNLFEKLIRHCKPVQDINDASIVSNEREYISDNRDSFLDEGRQGSFAPYLNVTRQNPQDAVYNFIMEQSPTRENYESYKSIKEHKEDEGLPMVGEYDSGAGLYGAGPLFPAGGFIGD